MSLPLIKVENIYYSYKEDNGETIPVIKDLSVEIGEGEFVAVLGHNGSGKSTFAKLLSLHSDP